MRKTESIKFDDFMSGEYKDKGVNKKALTGASMSFIFTPGFANAQADTFNNLHAGAMNMFDAGVVVIIIFAGASWALGHRGKAMEILIGVCCGYLLARHAVDIRDFLKSI